MRLQILSRSKCLKMLESFVLCDHLHVETRESQQLYFIALVFKGELRNCVLLEKGCSIYKVVSTRTFTHFPKKNSKSNTKISSKYYIYLYSKCQRYAGIKMKRDTSTGQEYNELEGWD